MVKRKGIPERCLGQRIPGVLSRTELPKALYIKDHLILPMYAIFNMVGRDNIVQQGQLLHNW